MLAEAGQFEHLALDTEARLPGGRLDSPLQCHSLDDFFGIAAFGTNQEITGVNAFRMRAANEGIAGGNTVNQPLLQQEVQRTVDRGRCRLVPFRRQAIKEVIGPQRLMTAPDQLQYAPAQGCQAGTAFRTQPVGKGQRVMDAMAVIMGMESGGHGRLATNQEQQYNICGLCLTTITQT